MFCLDCLAFPNAGQSEDRVVTMNFLYREVTDVAKSYEKQQKLAVSLGGGGGLLFLSKLL